MKCRRQIPLLLPCLAIILAFSSGMAASASPLRPPSVPLVSCDPYFSIWSGADRLADAPTTHWTGKPHRLTSLARIDGNVFRLMGADPAGIPALSQTATDVLPTQTVCTFSGAGVQITLTFLQPAIPDDLMLLSRPVVYVIWEARSADGKAHAVSVHMDAAAEIALNEPSQEVGWSRESIPGLVTLRAGSKDQPVLMKNGDDLRIDWGYLYLAATEAQRPSSAAGAAEALRAAFAASGALTGAIDERQPRPAADGAPALGLAFDLGTIGGEPVSRWAMLAYDDLFSIQYFKKNLRPYWRRAGAEAPDLLRQSAAEFAGLRRRCADFDRDLMADIRKAGGEDYARLCALAYRQCFGASKIAADAAGQPLAFPKENFSNGCIATVDVIYPMAPQFLLFGPSITKSMLVPIMDYAASPRWKFPFAPHDLGRYPHANKQRYGGGELTEQNQMPVEETGNMLVLLAALAKIEGHADFASKYWPLLEKWAAYLKDKGFDPENQLCTDDFAGHLAHNVNLSAKAICGIASFGQLCRARGDAAQADEVQKLARGFAVRWAAEADDGGRFRLAFDRPGSWSQKYNLAWDRILGLGLFPDAVRTKEMGHYRKSQNAFGLPLDSRKTYTKLDWTLWSATLTGERADFDALLGPVIHFINNTPDRVPLTDWYDTISARKVGFQARSVVGGVFLQMLCDPAAWKKWAARDATKAANWAPIPRAPRISVAVPAADQAPATWRFTTETPAEDWCAPAFDASGWKEGKSGFGAPSTPGAIVNTEWKTRDIWLRREFNLPERRFSELQLWIHHDEDADVFINGIPAARLAGFTSAYDTAPIAPAARSGIKPGRNILAIHCHQTRGGQYIDAGIVDAE